MYTNHPKWVVFLPGTEAGLVRHFHGLTVFTYVCKILAFTAKMIEVDLQATISTTPPPMYSMEVPGTAATLVDQQLQAP